MKLGRKIGLVIGGLGMMMQMGTTSLYAQEVKTVSSLSDYNTAVNEELLKEVIILNVEGDKAFVKGKEKEKVKVLMENGRTLVPLRFVAENLETKVVWEPENQSIQMTSPKHQIHLTLGSQVMEVDGKEQLLDTVPVMHQGITYLPLRSIGEALETYVEYNEAYRCIVIGKSLEDSTETGLIFNTLKMASTCEVDEIIYSDERVVIKKVGNKIAYWDIWNQPLSSSWIEIGTIESLKKEGEFYFFNLRLGDGIMGSDLIFTIGPDQKAHYLIRVHDLVEYKVKDGFLYFLSDGGLWNYMTDAPSSLKNFTYNLGRVEVKAALKNENQVEEPEVQYLGEEGYCYGFKLSLGSWVENGEKYPMGIAYNEETQEKIIDWEIKEDGVYAIGVDTHSLHADKTEGYYKISFTGNSHERIEK